MIHPERAPVRPRVTASAGGEASPLEDEVARLLEEGASGVVAVLGLPGAGKTTALRHLAAVLPGGTPVRLIDDVGPGMQLPAAEDCMVVYAATAEGDWPHRAVFRLTRWATDDVIEYLLHAHATQCKAVMARLQSADHGLFAGEPGLWRAVLDTLAADDALPNARSALHRHLEASLPDADLVARARVACLNALLASEVPPTPPDFPPRVGRLLRLEAVRLLLAGERLAGELREEGPCDWLAIRLPKRLVQTAATLAAESDRALAHLRKALAGPGWGQAMAVSLLHATPGGWVPGPDAPKTLSGAYLDGALWSGVKLPGANLSGADLSKADLRSCDLSDANLMVARLRGATLGGANLARSTAAGANFAGADLSEADARAARFDGADLTGATADAARLTGAQFGGANLARASFRGADLQIAVLEGCRLEGTDFGHADLYKASLSGLDLSDASLLGANLAGARLVGCNLEGLSSTPESFQRADLTGALLTGSVMPGVIFCDCSLVQAGLADVEWERADLRNADLRGVSFHLGSTRSGLVGSTIACEGSKTGFYTDDSEEQHFKSPEEIRKANLRGADLRGARIDGVDFYLVDLRDAVYDDAQAAHFRRCNAILSTQE